MATSKATPIKDQSEEIKSVEPIVLTYTDSDTSYTLEFSRATVAFAERQGFQLNPFNFEEMLASKPIEVLENLFYYSFQMHHRGINKSVTDKILHDDLGGMSTALMERLMALHTQAYEGIVNVNDEGKPKNPNLKVEL